MTAYPTVPYDPTRVVGRRILAFCIDWFLIISLVMLVLAPRLNAAAETEPASRYKCPSALDATSSRNTAVDSTLCFQWGDEVYFVPQRDADRFTTQYWGLLAAFSLLDLVVLQSLTGASVGKLLLGLRVVRLDGHRAGPGAMVVRWFLLLLLFSCCFIIDLVMVFTTKGHRRVGDFAAGTFVIRVRDVGHPLLIPGVNVAEQQGWGAPPGTGWTPPAPGWGPPPGADGGLVDTTATERPAPSGGDDGPIWDEARDTYIQYDRPREQWVQWDDRTKAWKPIDQ